MIFKDKSTANYAYPQKADTRRQWVKIKLRIRMNMNYLGDSGAPRSRERGIHNLLPFFSQDGFPGPGIRTIEIAPIRLAMIPLCMPRIGD